MLSDSHRIQARVSQMPSAPPLQYSPLGSQTQMQSQEKTQSQTQMPSQIQTPGQMQMPSQMQTPTQMQMQTPGQMQMPRQIQMQAPMPGTMMQQGPPPVMSQDYLPGYLKTLIGKYILAEFLIGTNTFIDRAGQLLDVGVNYFVLKDINFNTDVICDLYSVKFVTVVNR